MALKNIGSILSDWQGAKEFSGSKDLPRHDGRRGDSFLNFLKLVNNWSKVVGIKLANHTLPLKMGRGCLVIMTSHPLYAHQLQSFEEEIIGKIVEMVPRFKGKVKKISFHATEHFDIIHSQRGEGREDIKSSRQNFHQFDPRYIELKKRARMDLPPSDDSDLDSLLENLNVRYYDINEN